MIQSCDHDGSIVVYVGSYCPFCYSDDKIAELMEELCTKEEEIEGLEEELKDCDSMLGEVRDEAADLKGQIKLLVEED